mmetsp:Transcript_14551/g.28669  ORF Transcript_14551/g.28669 Transcript_14551/m.28669 type:complete len:270 (-) Transcript_14551:728-1537(-)
MKPPVKNPGVPKMPFLFLTYSFHSRWHGGSGDTGAKDILPPMPGLSCLNCSQRKNFRSGASYWTIAYAPSMKFPPTPGASLTIGIPMSSRCFLGPTPLSSSSFALLIVPVLKITSFLANATHMHLGLSHLSKRTNSTPRATGSDLSRLCGLLLKRTLVAVVCPMMRSVRLGPSSSSSSSSLSLFLLRVSLLLVPPPWPFGHCPVSSIEGSTIEAGCVLPKNAAALESLTPSRMANCKKPAPSRPFLPVTDGRCSVTAPLKSGMYGYPSS